ncbi:MAG TPA: hypothetical protein VFB45_27220 [Pseudolabrys sp.]|nr:hypothetical protein [Pseudolabrys sp.]
MRISSSSCAGVAAITIIGAMVAPGLAADLPPRPSDLPMKSTAAVYDNGTYLWVDGSYQSIKLPSYGLGVHLLSNSVTLLDTGVVNSFDPRATGAGASGGIGYIFPSGTLPSIFGAKARFELGGSYVQARRSQAQTASVPPGAANPGVLVGVNGVPSGLGFICGVPGCPLASTLSTTYAVWQVNGKLAGDYKLGMVTLTPSIGIFGGQDRVDQSFAQTLGGGFATTYNATTAVHWTDWGGKFGLATSYEFMPGVAVGLGGSIGLASRSATLSGNDIATGAFPLASAVSSSANTTAFLANVETSLGVRVSKGIALRGFAGWNYDNRVPGLQTPGFTGQYRRTDRRSREPAFRS